METTLTNQLNLIRLHILREFFRFHRISVDDKGFEIGALLNRIMDPDVSAVATIKAIRNFGATSYTIVVDNGAPLAVKAAVKEGLSAAGAPWTQDGATINVSLGNNGLPIGLLEAKKMYDLLRSM